MYEIKCSCGIGHESGENCSGTNMSRVGNGLSIMKVTVKKHLPFNFLNKRNEDSMHILEA